MSCPVAPSPLSADNFHVRIRNLDVSRQSRCLVKDLTATVARGSFVAVLGPSGCGKTTLLNCLAGMLPADRGMVEYQCRNGCVHLPNDFRPKIGLVFQHLRLTSNASVLTNVLCGTLGKKPWWRSLLGFPKEEVTRARHLLELVGLADCEREPVSRLSGGERQRVAIARTLIQEPELILADEPVSHLDRNLARKVLGYWKDACGTQGGSVVCVLHDRELAREFADVLLEPCSQNGCVWNQEANPVTQTD